MGRHGIGHTNLTHGESYNYTVEHKLLECLTYTATLKNILKNRKITEILKTTN